MIVRRIVAAAVVVLALAGCYGPDPNLTEAGEGKPFVTVQFPAEVQSGSVHTAVVEIENPGPGDMSRLSVTFSIVGQGTAQGGIPPAIVPLGAAGENEAISDVRPEPVAVSRDGIVYVFDGIDEGATKTIEFEIRVTGAPGPAANAVIVSDAEDVERARGARMETTIE